MAGKIWFWRVVSVLLVVLTACFSSGLFDDSRLVISKRHDSETVVHLPLVVSAEENNFPSEVGVAVGDQGSAVVASHRYSEKVLNPGRFNCGVEVRTVNISSQLPVRINKEEFCRAVRELGLQETEFIIWWYDQIIYEGKAYSAMAFREQMPRVGIIQLSLHPPGSNATDPVRLYNHLLCHELSHFVERGNEVHGSGFRAALGTLSAGKGRYKYQMVELRVEDTAGTVGVNLPTIKGVPVGSQEADEIVEKAIAGENVFVSKETLLLDRPGGEAIALVRGCFDAVSYGEKEIVGGQRYVWVRFEKQNREGWVATQ